MLLKSIWQMTHEHRWKNSWGAALNQTSFLSPPYHVSLLSLKSNSPQSVRQQCHLRLFWKHSFLKHNSDSSPFHIVSTVSYLETKRSYHFLSLYCQPHSSLPPKKKENAFKCVFPLNAMVITTMRQAAVGFTECRQSLVPPLWSV